MLASKLIARWIVQRQNKWVRNPISTQWSIFKKLISRAKDTVFGKEHGFSSISSYKEFKQRVPVRTYEDISSYIGKIKKGSENVLWPGIPLYFAETSGTTSGSKYIPITKESLPYHLSTARNALLNYIYTTGKSDFINGKMLFLSGSPKLSNDNVPVGRLSGIVNHHIPFYLKKNHLPSFKTNCIDNWEDKLTSVIDEVVNTKLTLISGIPPWVQMFFDRLELHTNCKASQIFSSMSLLVHGGVNFAPYRTKFFNSIGKNIDTIETYPASEGFIAFQDLQEDTSLLLQLNSGIFFEFIPMSEYFSSKSTRISLEDVTTGVDYALILSTNAGLWAYDLGDTIRFSSINPYKIEVTGRTKHFISAFGEHVIAEEIDKAMEEALKKNPEVTITEFTVAPYIAPKQEDSYHEWLIEFIHKPHDIRKFAADLENKIKMLNPYYNNLVTGKILQQLKINCLTNGTFNYTMTNKKTLGEQNKVVRLSNNRNLANELCENSVFLKNN